MELIITGIVTIIIVLIRGRGKSNSKCNALNIDLGKSGKWFYKSAKLITLLVILPVIIIFSLLLIFFNDKLTNVLELF